MLYRLRHNVMRHQFNRAISGILDTPPMPVIRGSLTILSMIATTDVPMYVLSMKAFYRRIGQGRLIAVIDRDMPRETRAILEHHFPGITFQILEEIDTGPCQRGGTWERILHILDLAESEYVVQVDSDTLPVADLQEVLDCIRNKVSFTMADWKREFEALPQAAASARATPGNYIGLITERLLDLYPDAANLRYVRGSSGLAGFAPGAFPRRRMEEFHQVMEPLVGKTRWREWGTEQCASNFAVANSPGSIVLPFPAYTSFHPGGPREEAKFFHFIGSFRFDDNYFAKRGQEEIGALMRLDAKPRVATLAS